MKTGVVDKGQAEKPDTQERERSVPARKLGGGFQSMIMRILPSS